MKYWKISFSMKKGSFNKYKPHLRFIQRNYKPHYLIISQQKFYEHWKEKPIPIIEFIVLAYDALHFMDDFIEKFGKQLMTGGAKPFKWMKIPKKARLKSAEKLVKKRYKKEKVIAEKMRKKYLERSKKEKRK